MTDSNEQICKPWLDACIRAAFGIILPRGWFGRPYDNQHVINRYSINKETLLIQFDSNQKIEIVRPKSCQLATDSLGNSLLELSEWQECSIHWSPYGSENSVQKSEHFYDGTLTLVGYFQLSPKGY